MEVRLAASRVGDEGQGGGGSGGHVLGAGEMVSVPVSEMGK